MKQLLQEAIETLEYSQVFISSRQKMHHCGQDQHQECIDKLKQEVERMQAIEDIKEVWENSNIVVDEDNEKNIGSGYASLRNLINNKKH